MILVFLFEIKIRERESIGYTCGRCALGALRHGSKRREAGGKLGQSYQSKAEAFRCA
jgi:hypothetical protein